MHRAPELGPFKIGVTIVEPGARERTFRFGGSHVGTPMKAYEGTPASMVHGLIKDFRLPAGDPVKMASITIASESRFCTEAHRSRKRRVGHHPEGIDGVAAVEGQKNFAFSIAHVGDGLNRWAAVHKLDAAHLYRLALEKSTGGTRYHGVGDEGVAFRDIAEVIGRHLNVPVVTKSREAAADHFGWLALFAGMDMPASSRKRRKRWDGSRSMPA